MRDPVNTEFHHSSYSVTLFLADRRTSGITRQVGFKPDFRQPLI